MEFSLWSFLSIARWPFVPSSPSLLRLVRQPLKHTSRDERVERWPTVARHRGGQDAHWYTNQKFMELSVHCCGGHDVELGSGTGKERCLEGAATRGSPERERGVVKNGGREDGGAGIQYALQTSLSLVYGHRVRRRNWRKLSYFRSAENKRRRRVYEKRCPITISLRRVAGWFIDLFSWYYRAIEIQCCLLLAVYCTSFLCNIDPAPRQSTTTLTNCIEVAP